MQTAQALIPVFTGAIHDEQAQLVDARTLHRFLQVDTDFRKWIARRIEEYDFQEGQDFRSFLGESSGGRRSREYHITLDMAKELSMVERNEKGRQARRYFIECEKRLQQIAPQEADDIRARFMGVSELTTLKGLIRDKAKVVPLEKRRSFQQTMHNRLHTRFNVPRIELIPAAQFESACNFIAAYALEGEWLPNEEKKPGTFVLDEYQAQFVHSLIHYTHWVCFRWDQGIGAAVKALNPKFHTKTWEFFRESRVCAEMLESALPELVAHFRSRGGLRPHDGIATGHPVGHPAD
ncbi:TPA: antA/AntB antirepressor family protein [Pseudomonas aeruginosa]|uniref:antA/AntB antirepressor family protein n=1 Tax=Pseudomonas aeruginosa TaxID=287 RepID=UPI00094086E1|nr:antA/AntB antirepressor family protein [Pseudomonas aeruginosa]MCS7728631.1 antA/AntB antirepressor family protein [Pseudomonas aeruginosa]OKR00975.1 hypothetical protein BH587_02755 [Pseudomonas aeruginosa]HBP4991393.1 hypothetical protein [Pseudomonas aeruginosa]